jgi:hypothetical protein
VHHAVHAGEGLVVAARRERAARQRQAAAASTGEREQEAVLGGVTGIAHDRAYPEALGEQLRAHPRADEAVGTRDGDRRALGEGGHFCPAPSWGVLDAVVRITVELVEVTRQGEDAKRYSAEAT